MSKVGWGFSALLLGGVVVGVLLQYTLDPSEGVAPSDDTMVLDRAARQLLLDQLSPVLLADCMVERFGAERDGGYLLCANLLRDVEVAYSYGIEGRDS